MTKSMLEKCLNKECVAFGKLPTEIKVAISDNFGHVEKLVAWPERWEHVRGWNHNEVMRLSPDTPTELEYEERIVELFDEKFLGVNPIDDTRQCWLLCVCVCHKRFIGIIYAKDGVETLRTSVDAAFGTPVRVRFAKGDK